MLRAVSEREAYANLALPALLRRRGISGRDAAFATELTYGTCRTQGLLDAVIGAAAGRSPQAIDPVLLDLLRRRAACQRAYRRFAVCVRGKELTADRE